MNTDTSEKETGWINQLLADIVTVRQEFSSSDETNQSLQRQILELTEQNKRLEEENSVLMMKSKTNGTSNGESSSSSPQEETPSGKMVLEQEWQGDELVGVYTGYLDENDNLILNTTVGIGFPLLGWLQGATEIVLDYNSGAVAGTEQLDQTYRFRLGYSW